MVQGGVGFAHRVFGVEFDAVSVVDEPVEDGIGDASAAEILVPVGHGQLRGHDGGAAAVALFDGFEQILLFPLGHTRKAKIVHDKDG